MGGWCCRGVGDHHWGGVGGWCCHGVGVGGVVVVLAWVVLVVLVVLVLLVVLALLVVLVMLVVLVVLPALVCRWDGVCGVGGFIGGGVEGAGSVGGVGGIGHVGPVGGVACVGGVGRFHWGGVGGVGCWCLKALVVLVVLVALSVLVSAFIANFHPTFEALLGSMLCIFCHKCHMQLRWPQNSLRISLMRLRFCTAFSMFKSSWVHLRDHSVDSVMSHVKQQKMIPWGAFQEESALDAWRRVAVPKLVQTLNRPRRTNLRDHTVDSVMSLFKQQQMILLDAWRQAALDAWRRAAVPKLVQTLSRPDRANLRDHTVDSVMSNYRHYSFWTQLQPNQPIPLSLQHLLEGHPSSSERVEPHEQLLLSRLMQEPDTFYNFTAPGPSSLAKLISSTSGYPLNCAWFVQTLIDSSETDWSKVLGYVAPSTLQQLRSDADKL